MPRVAAGDATDGLPATADHAIAADRFNAVVAAGRLKATSLPEQRADSQLIGPHRGDQNRRRHLVQQSPERLQPVVHLDSLRRSWGERGRRRDWKAACSLSTRKRTLQFGHLRWHTAADNDHKVVARRQLMLAEPEGLTKATLPAIPLDRRANPTRHGEPQPHRRHTSPRRLLCRPCRRMHDHTAIAGGLSRAKTRENALCPESRIAAEKRNSRGIAGCPCGCRPTTVGPRVDPAVWWRQSPPSTRNRCQAAA